MTEYEKLLILNALRSTKLFRLKGVLIKVKRNTTDADLEKKLDEAIKRLVDFGEAMTTLLNP